MGLRRSLAILTARSLSAICRLMGKQGVTMAGSAALKIDPDILRDLASQVRSDIVVVCGTNGKTTTNNLLCSMLESEGKKVVCNHTGSNMLAGVVASFVLAADLSGRLDADHACIEIDEASARRIFPHFRPQRMVVTNLFRDQLDRYGEIDITMDLLQKAIDMAPDLQMIINADDPLSVYLALESGRPYKTYGISQSAWGTGRGTEVREGRFCKRCGAQLEYTFYHYSQMGDYHCPQCGFARPAPDYDADTIDMSDGLRFEVHEPAAARTIHAAYRGFYNIYNILAAYSAARESGYELEHLDKVLDEYNPENGRNELFHIRGTEVLLNLAKNPAGFNQNISAVMEDRRPKDLIIVINDNAQDGTDISWLWDVDFERLSDETVQSITVTGLRGLDMRLRLKYVNMNGELAEDVRTAIEQKIENGCGNLYVLVNYTALYGTHKILKSMSEGTHS